MSLSARPVGRHLPLLLLLVATGALAQQVYRHVDKSGTVTFSDQAPSAAAEAAGARSGGAPGATPSANTGDLPYELRQVVQRYPVTIYTGDDCAPCTTGRSMLVTRGVPFDERTIKTPEDVAALQSLSGQGSLPLLTIGTQQLKGYSDTEWTRYLDAAGYPKSNQLSAGYNRPQARPLVAVKEVATSRPTTATAAPAPPPPPAVNTGPTPSNPAGIKF